MTRVLLPLLLLLALPGAYARPTRQYLGQCPGLEYGLPPFAAALRATCPVSTEGYSPPYEVRVSEPYLRPCGCLVGGKPAILVLSGRAKPNKPGGLLAYGSDGSHTCSDAHAEKFLCCSYFLVDDVLLFPSQKFSSFCLLH
jgi:hypothetical protein